MSFNIKIIIWIRDIKFKIKMFFLPSNKPHSGVEGASIIITSSSSIIVVVTSIISPFSKSTFRSVSVLLQYWFRI